MGDPISYRGKPRAYLSTISVPESRQNMRKVFKFVLTFDTLDDLVILLQLKDDEVVDVAGRPEQYAAFKREVLEKTHRIYPSPDSQFFDMMDAVM